MKFNMLAAIAASSLAIAGCTTAQMDDAATAMATASGQVSTVGGVEMYASRNIVENASNSPIHTTLVSALQAADLVDTLSGPGPFTVFAPTDEAFSRVGSDTLDYLMLPENKEMLQSVLTYHVVPGRITSADLAQRIGAGGGTATLETVQGEELTATMSSNGFVTIQGMGNSSAYVTQVDVRQSNGVIHVVDGVLMPSM